MGLGLVVMVEEVDISDVRDHRTKCLNTTPPQGYMAVPLNPQSVLSPSRPALQVHY